VFIFNTDLLLIDVTWVQGIIVFVAATIAILVFTAGTMGYFLTKSRIYESILLVAVAFALFRPDYFMDRIQPPYAQIPPTELEAKLDTAQAGKELRFVISGPDFDTGEMKDMSLIVPVPEDEGGAARMEAMGFIAMEEDGVMRLEEPMFGAPIADQMSSFDFYADNPVSISAVKVPQSQMPKELVFIPALLLLALVAMLQRARMGKQGEPA
jgi:hypothetical protein